MLRTSLYFLFVALICLGLADIEVTTLDPWEELRRIGVGFLTPDFPIVYTFRDALLNTVTFAFCGISLGVLFGSGLAFFFRFAPVRLFCAFIRAIHEIFWAFLFLPIVGLNPVCGILAIAIPYAGVFGKVYAEIMQEADQTPLKGLPLGTGGISRFCYGILPVIYSDLKNYTSYRFECALRSSAILGFVGLPTLGFHLETAFREGLYSEAPALLYAFYLLIASLRYWLKPKLVVGYVVASFALISTDVHVQWSNITRFLTYEILPWPMRRDGFLDGSGDVSFALVDTWRWMAEIFQTEVLQGVWNTVVLTQVVLVGTGLFTLLFFGTISRHFVKARSSRGVAHYFLIVLRTTPEYILAYAMLQLWGPSMLPAIVAIMLHNGAILSYLTGQNANLVQLPIDAARKKANRYFFEVLPRVYGQFLAFLFYRWEVMMRESAILGILGIYTLGFFIDSAISDDKLDKAVFLILITAVLNIGIDTISQTVRRRLRIATGAVFTYQQ
jgi:phosphonate transport system permease protein